MAERAKRGRSGRRHAAIQHLIGHGHERIAFVGHLAHFDVRERLEGYESALEDHGLTPSAELLFDAGDNHDSGGELVAAQLLAVSEPATAVIVVATSLVARGAKTKPNAKLVATHCARQNGHVMSSPTACRVPSPRTSPAT